MNTGNVFVETERQPEEGPMSPQAKEFGKYIARRFWDSPGGMSRQASDGLIVEITESDLATLLAGSCETGLRVGRMRR